MPGIAVRLLDGSEVAARADELLAVHSEVHGQAGDAALARRFLVQFRQPGFVLAEARHGGYLVGYASGKPLRSSTSWWKNLTTPLPAEVTTEHAGRTFALTELLVRAPWRRQGIASSLHNLILAGRPEERATLTVSPRAAAAQNAFRKWGWRKVARTHGPGPEAPILDILVTDLPARGQPPEASLFLTGNDSQSRRTFGPRGLLSTPGNVSLPSPWPIPDSFAKGKLMIA